jgi:hypothetical protein
LLLAGAAATEPPKVEPVATVTQLMQALIAPSSNALFDVARQTPADDQQWAAVRNNAVILAESGNLLMLEGRAQKTEAWMRSSETMVAAGAAAIKAADAKDVDAIIAVGDRIVDSCETCHEVHWDRSVQD